MFGLFTVEEIARVCHEANGSLCNSRGDHSQSSWDEAPEWQRKSAILGVEYAVANPLAPISAQHDSWSAQKVEDGWVYGPEKDPVAKTHPCLVPYEQLPPVQQAKDHLFKAIVMALSPL
jgi:hypothetical protein